MIVALSMLSACVELRAADDPLIGTWKLNIAKSTFQPGPPPQSPIRKHELNGDGIKVISDTIANDGKQSHLQFTAAFDEKFYPIMGTGNAVRDGSSLKRISPYVVEGENGAEGKPTTRIVWTVSKDGKMLTDTIDSIVTGDRAVHNVSVYDKQ
jgi:hypothetical protein